MCWLGLRMVGFGVLGGGSGLSVYAKAYLLLLQLLTSDITVAAILILTATMIHVLM